MRDLETGVVLMLKSSDRYITREELARGLGASPAEVEGVVQDLRSRGYRIDEVPGHGCRLVSAPASLGGCELRTALSTRLLGTEVFPFGRVTSTNDVAFALARAGSPEGALVIAEEQTRGKGRLGRVWHSAPDVGLWFSVILRPRMEPYLSSTVSLAAALAVAGVMRDDYGVDARIKWPNDVMVGVKKICGILTEAEFRDGEVEFVIVGVGINALHAGKDFPPELRGIATSVRQESTSRVERLELLGRLLGRMEEKYLRLCAGGFKEIRGEILPLSSLIGNMTRVETGNGVAEGVAADIDETGALILRRENGLSERVIAGDATLL